MMKRIKSTPLYPRAYEPLLQSDPPKGCALASRIGDWSGARPVSEPWPEVAIGEEIEIETTNHWLWRATLEEVRDADHWVVRIAILRMEKKNSWDREESPVYAKEPIPLPPVVEGQPYVLPYMSGDAWSVRPEKGKILTIGGKYYRVTNKPRRVNTGYEYQLAPVSAEAYAKRPGRILIKDLTDPNPDSHRYYGHNVGRIIQIGDEWLHVQKVERVPYGDAEGREIFGYNVFGVGHFVPATKAAKLKAQWDAKEKVRSLELSLRVAKQDLDYGGNPDAVPGLEAELAAARKAAGIGRGR